MKEIKAKLSEKIPRTPSIMSFRLRPEEKLDFISGQFLQVIFNRQNLNDKELNKYLSFSSSPTKEYIQVTKRLSESKFSQALRDSKPGDEILLLGPLGDCIFKEEYKKIGFLIGGIGITPVISIIEYIIDKKLGTDILLFYSNRSADDIAFKKELDQWQKENKNLKVVYIQGRIDKNLLLERVYQLNERIFFIYGPPKMIEAMNNLCLELGCAKENIKKESFIGY